MLMIALLPSCQEAVELLCKSHTQLGVLLMSILTRVTA